MKTNIRIKISQRIKTLRSKTGLTQETLAELSGVDYKHIQLLESKNPPAARVDTIEKIARAFKLDLHEFFKF